MQQRSSTTRENILSSARGLFAQFGYDATGVAEICEKARVSKGAFYHHFPSKHAVFMAILKEWLDSLDQEFSSIRNTDGTVLSSLAQMSESAGRIFSDAEGQFPMFLEFWSKAIRDERVWTETKEPFLKYFYFFAQMIRKGIEEGSIKKTSASTASRALVGMALGIILQGMMYPEEADWDTEMQASIEILLKGLQSE
jgi:AcrR family transcriptional regulator